MTITLEQLAIVIPNIKELFFQWLEANDQIDIDSLIIGYLAAHEHEGMTYAEAKTCYERLIKDLLPSWENELTNTTENEEEGI